MSESLVVSTKCGDVQGFKEDGFVCFKGIPFAAAERFGAPQPVCWEGVKDCTVFGKKAMQDFNKPMPWIKPQSRDEFDEDCLNLNIYAPENADNLPVLLEIHGGAFQDGSNQIHTPKQMIRDNRFIYVAVNYRLGVFGFLCLDGLFGDDFKGSGNSGLLDLMASVRWVHENIKAFGGNPDKITVMGSSAGAKALGALMCMEELNDYASQVILSSGATQSIRSVASAQVIAKDFLKALGEKTGKEVTKELLLSVSPDTLIEAQREVCNNPGNTCTFGPVADGVVLPTDWTEISLQGTLFKGAAMVGSSRHELAFYKFSDKDFDQHAPMIAEFLFGKNADIAKADFEHFLNDYKESKGEEPPVDMKQDWWVKILTDYMYRTYTARLGERLAKKGCPVWQYSVEFMPAVHCLDQQLAFEGPNPMFFPEEDYRKMAGELGEKIYQSFVGFVENGTPGWEARTMEHPCMMAWNIDSQLVEITPEDTLQGMGEAVYVLA